MNNHKNDLEHYEINGFRLMRQMVPVKECETAIRWLEEITKTANCEQLVEPEFEAQLLEGERPIRKLRRLLWSDEGFWLPLLERAGLLDLGSTMVRGNPALIFHAAFLKPRLIGSPVALHQDQALWTYQYPGAVSVWIALSASTVESGCLEISPRSHSKGLLVHRWDPDYPWHPCVQARSAGIIFPKKIPMEAGDVLIWERYTVHGSGPNVSNEDRKGMVLVFADATAPDFKSKDIFRI